MGRSSPGSRVQEWGDVREHSGCEEKQHMRAWEFIPCLRSMSGPAWLRHKGMDREIGEGGRVG